MKIPSMSARLVLCALTFGLMLQTQVAHAGFLGQIRLSMMLGNSKIEPESVDIMGQAAQDISTAPNKHVGDATPWKTPVTAPKTAA